MNIGRGLSLFLKYAIISAVKSVKSKGYTLVEVLMVVVILGQLAVMVTPRFVDLQSKAKQSATRGALGAIRSAIAVCYSSNSAYNVTTNNSIPTTIEAGMFQDSQVPREQVSANSLNSILQVTSEVAVTGTDGGWAYDSLNGQVWVNHSDYTAW